MKTNYQNITHSRSTGSMKYVQKGGFTVKKFTNRSPLLLLIIYASKLKCW